MGLQRRDSACSEPSSDTRSWSGHFSTISASWTPPLPWLCRLLLVEEDLTHVGSPCVGHCHAMSGSRLHQLTSEIYQSDLREKATAEATAGTVPGTAFRDLQLHLARYFHPCSTTETRGTIRQTLVSPKLVPPNFSKWALPQLAHLTIAPQTSGCLLSLVHVGPERSQMKGTLHVP